MLRDTKWYSDRRDIAQKLISWLCFASPEVPDEILDFAYNIKDSNCEKCEYWTNACSYDSGRIGQCTHPKITGGPHHPSNGCGMVEMTLMYIPSCSENQEIFTRWNFGCNLWEKKNG